MKSVPARMPATQARPGIFPMTYEQESVWLGERWGSGPSRYLESWACRLAGRLDIGAVEWAISQIAARHEVLRSRLTLRAGQPVQVVTPARPVPVVQVPCARAALPAELGRVTAEPIDLDEAPFRPWLLRLAPQESVLVVQFHHAVVDDWALGVFQRELTHFYTARVLGRPAGLAPLSAQAGDYALAQRAAGTDAADIAYWRKQLRSAPQACTIPPDKPGPHPPGHRGGRQLFRVSPALGNAVRAVGRARRTTPYTVFAAAMAALLSPPGKQAEVMFGTPVSHRGPAAVDGMIGCLSDLLPLRLSLPCGASFGALADAAKAGVVGAMEHHAVPYSVLVRMLRRRMEAGTAPLCPTALVVDDLRWEPLSLPGITAERIYIPPGQVKFDVCITLVAAGDGGYAGFCDYDAGLYRAATMARVAGRFTRLLARGTVAADEPLASPPGPGRGACHD